MKTTKENPHVGHRQRLRNRFVLGKQAFQEHELLELLLSYAIPRKDTNALAHKLINTFGSLSSTLQQDVEVLQSVEGIGQNAACFLSLVGYVNSINAKPKNKAVRLSSISDTKEHLIELYKGADHETFTVVFLNDKNKVVGMTKCDSNSDSKVELDFAQIGKGILLYNPASIIVAHNHFEKFPSPSSEDDDATAKIYTFLQLYKINFYDHLIISGKEVYSYFYDNRLAKIKEKVNNTKR